VCCEEWKICGLDVTHRCCILSVMLTFSPSTCTQFYCNQLSFTFMSGSNCWKLVYFFATWNDCCNISVHTSRDTNASSHFSLHVYDLLGCQVKFIAIKLTDISWYHYCNLPSSCNLTSHIFNVSNGVNGMVKKHFCKILPVFLKTVLTQIYRSCDLWKLCKLRVIINHISYETSLMCTI